MDERDKSVGEKFYKGGSTIELKCVVRQVRILGDSLSLHIIS